MKWSLAGAVFALAVIPVAASAFEQTLTCTGSGGPFPCQPGEVALPVEWGKSCVVFYVNEEGTDDVPGDGTGLHPLVLEAVRQSFATWSDVGQSSFKAEYGGLTNDSRAEYSSARDESGNANIVMWRDTDWPYASDTAFAITSVTFDPSTGVIADADIEMNGEHHRFTVGDSDSVVDVQNTLTHEVGHFLGLDHSNVADATMFGRAPEGETQKRTLHTDDIAGLVSIYPGGESDSCGDYPDYFEAPGDETSQGGCCRGSSSVETSRPAPFLALLLGLLAFANRRRQAVEIRRR